MRRATKNRDKLMLRAARLYHEEGLSQEQIARRLFMSRPEVSRLLSKAKEAGVVRITVVPPTPQEYLEELRRQVRERFELRDVILAPGREEIPDQETLHSLLHLIAAAAARYLDETLSDDDVLSVAWGYNTRNVMRHLQPSKILPSLTVVPMLGCLSHRMDLFDSNGLARDFAMAYGGQHLGLPAPAIVRTRRQQKLAAELPLVRETLEALRRATVAITSMAPASRNTTAVREGFIRAEELTRLVEAGAVGEMCGWYFDERGRGVSHKGVASYPIGMELRALREMVVKREGCRVIGIAGADPERYPPILAALRGRLINVLATDHITATRLLAM
ncbi:MAG: sugar-binding domain-containing protein [Armatimonadota bacterium]|jgi:deoxyribonucleoside regulator